MMLTRFLAGGILFVGLLFSAPLKAQDPSTVQGDPATTNQGSTSEQLRANNKAAARDRRAENKRTSREHKAEVKRANHSTPRSRRAHEHGAKPKQTHASRRSNPHRSKRSSHAKRKTKTTV